MLELDFNKQLAVQNLLHHGERKSAEKVDMSSNVGLVHRIGDFYHRIGQQTAAQDWHMERKLVAWGVLQVTEV